MTPAGPVCKFSVRPTPLLQPRFVDGTLSIPIRRARCARHDCRRTERYHSRRVHQRRRSRESGAGTATDLASAKPGRDPNQPIDTEYTARSTSTRPSRSSSRRSSTTCRRRKTVPTPKAVLGDIAGAPTKLPYSKEVYEYMRLLAKATPRVKVFSIGTTEEGREMIAVAVASEAMHRAARREQGAPRQARRSAHDQDGRRRSGARSCPTRRRSTTSPAPSTRPEAGCADGADGAGVPARGRRERLHARTSATTSSR